MSFPTAKRLSFEALREGATASADFIISSADMRRFAELSGDLNPLHTDDDFARTRGFEGRLVYGGLIVAQVSRLIGMELPGVNAVWTGLDLQFRNPLYVGQQAIAHLTLTHLSEATRSAELKIRVRAGDRLLASGTASVSIADAS